MTSVLPSKSEIEDFFSRLRALLWGIFEVVLFVLTMAAVTIFAWKHIPASEMQPRIYAEPQATFQSPIRYLPLHSGACGTEGVILFQFPASGRAARPALWRMTVPGMKHFPGEAFPPPCFTKGALESGDGTRYHRPHG